MKRSDFVRIFAGALGVTCSVLPVVAQARTQYLHCLAGQNYWEKFYTLDGKPVARSVVQADPECEVWTSQLDGSNITLDGKNFTFYSWRIDATNITTKMTGPWVDGSGVVTLGAGGLTMGERNLMRFGNPKNNVRIALAASQTWRGPSSGTAWSYFHIGSYNTWGDNKYWHARIAANDSINWTIDGRIKVALTGPNDLSNVDVVVKPKARLLLLSSWADGACKADARLKARSLTLEGGDTESSEALLTVGAKNPATWIENAYAPAAFNDDTFSPDIRLLNGASITGGTVDYGVSRLTVSGGASSFSGTVRLKKKGVVDIAAGARLSFTGSVTADSGAGLEVTGAGELCFSSGSISVPLSGNGCIVCDPASGEETVVTPASDLSSFEGTIYVARGTLLVSPAVTLNENVTIRTAQGASWRKLTDADYGDFEENGRMHFRDSDGILHAYLYQNAMSGKNGEFGFSGFRRTPAAEESHKWEDGSVYVIDRTLDAGQNVPSKVEVAGIIVEPTSAVADNRSAYFSGPERGFALGSRGIEIKKPARLEFWSNAHFLTLLSNQTWRGPAQSADGKRASVNLGGTWSYMYPRGSIAAEEGADALTLAGYLTLAIYYPSNDFSKTTLTVQSPARVSLTYPGGASEYPQEGNTHPWTGRINAKKLILDGEQAYVVIDYTSKFPELSAVKLAPVVELRNGVRFQIYDDKIAPTTTRMKWHGDMTVWAGSGNGALAGNYALQSPETVVGAYRGATLDLTSASFTVAPGVSAHLRAAGEGTVRLSFAQLASLTDGVVVDGAAIEVSDSGSWQASLADASGFTVAADGVVSITSNALEGYKGGKISVTSGLLVLDSVAVLPEGCTVETSGNGKLILVDWTGFDSERHMSGTKAYGEDPAVITATPRENETLVLGDGEKLYVFGPGLAKSTSVTLGQGSRLVFHRSSDVASPVTVTGASVVSSMDPSLTARFTSAVAIKAPGTLDVSNSGRTVFAGTIGLEKGAFFNQRKGTVVVQGGTSTFSGAVTLLEGHFVMTNCSVYSYNKEWQMGSSAQTGDVLCEIAANGFWKIDNNSIPYIGGHPDYESRLLINGGTLQHGTPDTMRLCENGNGKGVIELAAGELVSQRRVIVGRKADSATGYAKFIWRGGKWSPFGSKTSKYIYRHFFQSKAADCGGLEFSIEGAECVLDLGNLELADCVSNFYALASSKMTGKPGARLTVRGKNNVASRLVLLGFEPNGMALDLNNQPRVDVDVVGSGEPIALGWTVPGQNGTVRCIGTPSPLEAGYDVRPGGSFVNAYVGTHWNSGFSSVVQSNLVFGADALYLLRPSAQGLQPLTLAGSLSLPSSMRYAFDAAPAPVGRAQLLVEASGGIEGECIWTAAGGVSKNDSIVYAEGGNLLFDFVPKATSIFIR